MRCRRTCPMRPDATSSRSRPVPTTSVTGPDSAFSAATRRLPSGSPPSSSAGATSSRGSYARRAATALRSKSSRRFFVPRPRGETVSEDEAKVALIAHDGKKDELRSLVADQLGVLRRVQLIATETTGRLIEEEFALRVELAASGPAGGDLQIGALVANGVIDLVVFLRDPLSAHPHEPDIQALMKVCDVYRIPLATNVTTAALCLEALAA